MLLDGFLGPADASHIVAYQCRVQQHTFNALPVRGYSGCRRVFNDAGRPVEALQHFRLKRGLVASAPVGKAPDAAPADHKIGSAVSAPGTAVVLFIVALP